MNIAVFLKENLKNIPPDLGKMINLLPYQYRPGLGKTYRQRKNEIGLINACNIQQKQNFVFERVKNLVVYSYENIPFYRTFYDDNNFDVNSLITFDDLKNIPITTKEILNKYDIEYRSAVIKDRYTVNTGGSSGSPFQFYIQPDSMGHEWAHMHTVWGKLDYKVSDYKLVFGGRSDLKDKSILYDVVRNNFALDIYEDYRETSKILKKILKKSNIKYLHGYPTSIYDFAQYCNNEDRELQKMLSKSLVGAFFGSEYPHSQYRSYIEDTFDIKTISWYGHSERAVLAYEKEEQYVYEPFLSYGFAEAIPLSSSDYNLVATSYYNFASPLIRYNTEDIISNINVNDGILNSFKISKGRKGDYVIDRKGKKINLTGLVFGRHHELFNETKFIQVKQEKIGEIEIHFVPNKNTSNLNAAKLFDKDNLDMDIIFISREKPHRTPSGKVNLLIR